MNCRLWSIMSVLSHPPGPLSLPSVVGWMIAPRESAVLAERLIADTCAKHGIHPGQLTLHADRGTSMKSKPVALLLADLGVTKTHSRPHVSNDNPFLKPSSRR